MALTATPQSALQDVSWDESIVPTLRKRLEIESRAISKRMSIISMATGEDGTLSHSQKSPQRPLGVTNKPGGRITPSSMNSERPSAIPRPSLNYSRPSGSSANAKPPQASTKGDMKRQGQQRARTYSQPFASDVARSSNVNGSNGQFNSSSTRATNALPTPVSSRSNSPVLPPSPTFSPKDTRNTKGLAGRRADQGSLAYNRPLQLQGENEDRDQWDADEDTFDASFTSIFVGEPRHVKRNGLLHEPPPFSANSSFASEIDERPSLEERPYEHWYRGDLARNGGVGELRIGNRMEMLEIASYGHRLQNIRNDTLSRQRRRAESIGHRESVILTDDHEISSPMVLDETPLTDMEADTEFETDREQSVSRENQASLEQPKQSTDRSAFVQSTPKRRQPTQKSVTTPRAPRTTQRTASEPLHTKSLSSSTTSTTTPSRTRSPANSNVAKISNSQSQPLNMPSQKRGRAKSPAITPASKKPRPPAAQQKRAKSTGAAERLRPSGPSEYPDVPDVPGSMADAIPSWTQPKKAGNWDDVVLPAVARKMGLEDQYEEADGSPKAARPPSEEVAPPQPGTFGFDPSKRRQRYEPATGEQIPMEELKHERAEEENDPSPTKMVTVSEDTRLYEHFGSASRPNGNTPSSINENGFQEKVKHYAPPPSPAPFVQYQAPSMTRPEHMHEPVHDMTIEEEKHNGCCGCIIM